MKRAQETPNLRENCVGHAENLPWAVDNHDDRPHLIQRQVWACQQQLALINLDLRRADELRPHFDAPEMSAPRLELQKVIKSIFRGLSFGYQLVGSIQALVSTETVYRGRKRGGASSNRKPKKTEMEQLITTMVKLLYQSDPPKSGRATKSALTERYTDRILTIWANWPFFCLSDDELTNHVSNAVLLLDLPSNKNDILFKRRMQTTMARPRPEDLSSNANEAQRFSWECKARQGGISDALIQVLEGKFGALEPKHRTAISQASPEQLGVWLRCVHDREDIDELLRSPSD